MLFFYDTPGFDEAFGNMILNSPTNMLIIALVYYLIALVSAIWTSKNANKRGMMYKYWFLGVLLTGIIGLLVFLTIRDPIPSE